jgi:HlyB family type I secretion system ABC transporter
MSQIFTPTRPHPTLLNLLSSIGAEALLAAIDRQADLEPMALGDDLWPLGDANSLDLWLVCEGRVRLLCEDGAAMVSLRILEAGTWFGSALLQRQTGWDGQTICGAIAATEGWLLRLDWAGLQPLLAQSPAWQTHLQSQSQELARLIFFKTQTALGSRTHFAQDDNSPQLLNGLLNSQQLVQLLPLCQSVEVPSGQKIAPVLARSGGHYWLRQGTLQDHERRDPGLAIGALLPQQIPSNYVAATAVQLEHLAETAWDNALAIAPPLAAHLNPGRALAAASSPSPTPKRSLLPQRLVAPEPSTAAATPPPTAASVQFPHPQRRRLRLPPLLRRYPLIEQQSSSDCSVACLAMISQYWGQPYPLHHLRTLAKVGRSGATLRNLAAAAEAIGFQASPVRASLDRLVNNQSPWIAHWEGEHYIVVYQIRGNQLLVADPAAGKRLMKRSEFVKGWTGYALLLEVTDRLKKYDAPGAKSLGQFWQLLLSYRGLLGQIIGVSLVLQLCGLFTPLFTQIILDRVVVEKSFSALHLFSIGLLLFSLWRVVLEIVRNYLLDYLSNRMNLTLISGFINHTLKLPLKFFEDRSVGDIITRIQENSKIQQFLINQAVSTWLDAVMAISYIGLMVYYNWRLALLVLGLIPPIVILTLVATPFLKQISREVFKESADNTALVVEMMSGLEAVKSAAVEREIRWRWEEKFVSLLNVQFKGEKLGNGLQGVGGLINSVGSAALLWYGASLVIQGELTIGQFVAFNMLIGNVIGPVLAVIGVWDEFQEVLIAVERLNDVFEAQPEVSDVAMFALPKVNGEVAFDQVSFRYDESNEQSILQNLSFVVRPGETIALVGRSGSGKTTMIKLLQGMYQPTQGRVLVDGHDLQHVLPQSLRSQMGVVPQECFLFSGTIQDNIQLYRPEFTLEQVIEAAKLAEAHAFVQALPLAYNTRVGERGANLSGGQRQRLAIARALLGDPQILILDEATSALDTESERRFQENLERFSRDRTTFIIAHRLSTVQRADRILVLDRGILIEQGNHETLMAQQGVYYHLAQQQLNL